ncbi:MAG: hypothetical protein NTV92_01320, partial [Candidatus Bipolaricaulota bacterium]|nr:hypothetical protein [Candidatus Bipolaricaulota bacterium]
MGVPQGARKGDAVRRSAISCLVVLLSALIASLVALGQEDSQTVLAGVPDASQYAGQDLVVLLLETSQRLDPSPPDGGRPEWVVREHVRYWLLTAQSAEDASSLFAPICAVGDVRFLYVRAILPTGEVVAVKGIVPIDTSGTALATRSYYRFRPPRNTLRAGAVLEYEAEVRFDAACGFVAGGIPLLPSSLAVAQCHTVEAPPGQELCWDVIGDVDLRVLRNGSIHEFTVLDVAETSEERGAPCSISPTMSVVFTTATSWSALADAE